MKYTEKQLTTLNDIIKTLYEINLNYDVSRKNYDIKVLAGEDDNIYLTFKQRYSGGEGVVINTIFNSITPVGNVVNLQEKHSIHELCNFFVTLKPLEF